VTVRSVFTLAAAVGLGLASATYAGPFSRSSTTPAKGASQDNQKLADEVAARIKKSGAAAGARISVTAKDGVVMLDGAVRSPKQAEMLVQQALSVPGVVKVETTLKLANTAENVRPVQAVEPAPLEVAPPGSVGAPIPAPIPPSVPAPVAPPIQLQPGDPIPLAAPGGPPVYDPAGPKMPNHAWPTYAPYPNFSRVAYPQAYPYNAFPFIGPYYPFPKVPLGWRSVKLEWDDGHWYLGRLSTPHDYWRVRFW
jgi:hypothetical protein